MSYYQTAHGLVICGVRQRNCPSPPSACFASHVLVLSTNGLVFLVGVWDESAPAQVVRQTCHQVLPQQPCMARTEVVVWAMPYGANQFTHRHTRLGPLPLTLTLTPTLTLSPARSHVTDTHTKKAQLDTRLRHYTTASMHRTR
eukprot:155396-Chlamydomonas_euryale.AAC.2